MGLFTNKGFSSMILKRALCIGTFIFSLTILHAQVQRDKVLHFGGGVLSGAAGALVANKLSDGNRFWTFTGAVGGSLIAGVVKETIDQGKSDNRWDNGDLAATVFGGVTVGVTIDLFSGKKRRNKNPVSVGLR
ncbi:MAG: hypothetical protein WA913_07085 [Pricia sp.]